jgi:hypothetical protein
MDLTRSHHFAHPIDEVWAMLHHVDAHVAKFDHMGHREIVVVSSDVTDDTLDVTIRRVLDIEVPSVARKILKPTNTVTSTDHWQRNEDGNCEGHYEVDIKGVPVESHGTTEVVADDDGEGCTYTVALVVKVKVPIVGDKIAGALRGQLEKQIDTEFEACEAWLGSR